MYSRSRCRRRHSHLHLYIVPFPVSSISSHGFNSISSLPLVTGIAGRRGDPRSRERRPKSRNGNAPGRLPERRRNSTSLPAGTRPRHHANSTAPPWELDRAASGRTRSRAERLLHRGKVREAKRKRSAAPINQHREGGRSRASAGTLSLVPSRPSFLLVVSGTSPQINLDHGSC